MDLMEAIAIYEALLVLFSMVLGITLFFRFSKKQEFEDDSFKPPPPPFPELEEDKGQGKKNMSEVLIAKKPKREKLRVLVREKDLDNLFNDFDTLKNELPEEEKIEIDEGNKEIIRIKSIHHLNDHDREEVTEEISHAIQDIQEKKSKTGFWSFLQNRKKRNEKVEKRREVKEHAVLEEDHVSLLKSQINDARTQLMNFNLKGAKKIYVSIMATYNSLAHEDQEKVYDLIKDLYDERKNAENLMKK